MPSYSTVEQLRKAEGRKENFHKIRDITNINGKIMGGWYHTIYPNNKTIKVEIMISLRLGISLSMVGWQPSF